MSPFALKAGTGILFSHSMRGRSSAAVAKVTNYCLLAIWILTPLLSVAHVALEQHSYCIEHERLEEGQDGHSQVVESDEGGLLNSRPPAGHDEAGHEACAFGEDFTRASSCIVSYVLVANEALAFAGAPALSTSVVESTRLLLVAPKNSPPLIA